MTTAFRDILYNGLHCRYDLKQHCSDKHKSSAQFKKKNYVYLFLQYLIVRDKEPTRFAGQHLAFHWLGRSINIAIFDIFRHKSHNVWSVR